MSYITTNHRFIIDDKHPADVFDEMENFFSLYTVAMDDLQQVSVQLSIPASFDIQSNKKLGESYRQFTKALKYTLPDIHILPIKTTQAVSDVEDEDRDDNNSDDDNSVILLIQRLDGYVADDEDKPSLYQSVLGKLLPRFGGNKTDTGLYPAREQIAIPTPVSPQPVPQPVTQPIHQPQPQVVPSYQPEPAPYYQQPAPVPPQAPQPSYQPSVQPAPVVPPMPQAMPQTPVYQAPTPIVQPSITQPSIVQSSGVQPSVQPPVQPVVQPVQSPRPLERLPNIAKSAKPYQDLLTQAIIRDANKQLTALKGKPISQITLKSADTLTTAMIEQLFFSFNHSKDKSQTAHDALDLVSYGHEVLKPQLAKLGLSLSEDAQFGLKTNHKATSNDTARLTRGEVFANELTLSVKLKADERVSNTQTASMQNGQQNAHTPVSAVSTLQFTPTTYPTLNANTQRIALTLKIQDTLGVRQQAIRQFPMVIVTGEHASRHDSVRVYGITATQADEILRIIELDGNVMLDGVGAIRVERNGQPLNNGSILMPNNVLSLDSGKVLLQLLLV